MSLTFVTPRALNYPGCVTTSLCKRKDNVATSSVYAVAERAIAFVGAATASISLTRKRRRAVQRQALPWPKFGRTPRRQPDPTNILVVGECGDGKSTLIDSLRNTRKSKAPKKGKDPQGVTKDINLYPCPDLDGVPFNLVDTPGVGDLDVPPMKLVSMIEEALKKGIIPGGIRGIVVTTPVPDGRVKLGAQIVQAIVDKGFVAPNGADKYRNIILCGTKEDKADREDKDNFMSGLHGNPSVQSLFFANTKTKSGLCVMVSNKLHGYQPLLDAIRKLPERPISYSKPKPQEMSEALAAKLGVQAKGLERELKEMRKEMDERGKVVKALLEKIDQQDKEHRAEKQRKEEMIQALQREVKEAQARMELSMKDRDAAAAAQQRELMEKLTDAETNMKALQEQMQDAEDEHNRQMQEMQCFPGATVLQTPAGPKAMTELRVGDAVLAVDARGRLRFEDIYFFGHADPTELMHCVRLRTSSGRMLLASTRHFIPVASSPAAQWAEMVHVYAKDVRVGDFVWVRQGDGSLASEAVTETATERAMGAFNPYTLGGTILADGVVASAHSAWILDDICPSHGVRWLPTIYQAAFLPWRLLYRALGSQAAQEVTSPKAFAFGLATMTAVVGGAFSCSFESL